jgi:hypothetical protein
MGLVTTPTVSLVPPRSSATTTDTGERMIPPMISFVCELQAIDLLPQPGPNLTGDSEGDHFFN